MDNSISNQKGEWNEVNQNVGITSSLSTIWMNDLYATIIHVPADYPTISSAISAANPGDTIIVAAGVYNEHVVINVANLTLLGAQANVDARTRTYIPANESIITFATPAFGTGIVNIASPNVIFNGFTVQGNGTIVNSTAAIFAGDDGLFFPSTTTIDVTGLQLLNNIVQNNANGILIASIEPTPKTPNYLVQYNYLQNNSGDPTSGNGQGVFFNNSAGSVMTNVTVTENLFNGMETSSSVYLSNVTTATVSYNVMNQDNSIALFGTTGVSIIGNVTSGATGIISNYRRCHFCRFRLFKYDNYRQSDIHCNKQWHQHLSGKFKHHHHRQLYRRQYPRWYFACAWRNVANSNITINNNNIRMNTTGLNLDAGSYTSPPPLLDATSNYWNSALGPNYNGMSPGAGDLITDNNIPATQTVQYTPFLTNAIVCPFTAVASPSSQTICSGSPTSISLSSNVLGTTFSWTVSQSGVSGASSGSGATIAQTLTATGNSSGTATYTIIPIFSGFPGSSITVIVTVNPSPIVVASPSSQTICSGSPTSISLSSNVPGTTFSWTVSQSGVSGASSGSGSTIAQTLTATGNSSGTATYTITPMFSGCPGSSITVIVTVNPSQIAVASPSSQTICSGSPTSISLSSTVPGTTFSWTVSQSGVSGASSGSGSTIAQTLTATGNSSGTATYTITPMFSGCPGSSITVIVTVNPSLIAVASPSSQTIFSGSLTSISLSSNVPGTTFSWTVSQSGVSGASSESGSTIAQTLTATGNSSGTATYTITPMVSGCPALAYYCRSHRSTICSKTYTFYR